MADYQQSPTPPLPMIFRYPGECITFNMVKSSRVKGFTYKDTCAGAEQQKIIQNTTKTAKGSKRNKEVISISWEDEGDGDHFLIIRLIQDKGHPWVIAHHGIHVIFKGPLFVPIVDSGTETLAVFLQDSAYRGGEFINRKFYLTFASIAGAKAFQMAHNEMIFAQSNIKKYAKRKASTESLNGMVEGDKRGREVPPFKKQRKSHATNNMDKDLIIRNDRDKEGKTGDENKNTLLEDEGGLVKKKDNLDKLSDDYEVRMGLFESDFNLDDGFVETQDPFEE